MSDIPDDFQAALSDRYPIGREIGRGGMGTVYLAQDRRHSRAVAVKVLHAGVVSPDLVRRFRREIEIAARLNHPHIVPIYDSGVAAGVPYCVMPCIEGESLRQRLLREPQLPIAEAIDIARQVADALHYAHQLGVVHRDVKPENLLLARSHVLVVDFGIARAIGGDDGQQTTESRMVVGTPMYMSPEQASGAANLDARCDIYALGCVLYEMLAGQPPFSGPTVESVLRQHLALGAPPVTALRPATPRRLATAISRALAKTPADRFQTAAALGEALADRGADSEPQAGEKIMLVVLPLENLSGQPDQDYFADGLTEELITQIARLSPRELGVIARTTAMRYRQTRKSIAEIGAELGVQFVLDGSARIAGTRVRVTVQLIKVEDQTNVWADTYDRDLADVFAVQDDVGHKVAKALQVRLLEPTRPAADRERTENPQAYDTYLRGQHFARAAFITKDPADYERALDLFRRAVEIDSGFTPPLAALARLSFEHYRDYGHAASLSVAEDVARRLLQRNPNSAPARGTLASVYLWSGRKEPAMREARMALEQNPAEVAAHEALGVAFNMSGLLEEAIEQFTTWRALDPLAPAPCRRLVDGYIWTGNFEHARALLTDALTLYPRSPVFRRHLARIWYQTGDFERAEDLLKETLELEPYRGFEARGQLALVYARTGRIEAGSALLTPAVLEYAKRDVPESIVYPAQFYSLTGNVGSALNWLQAAIDAGNENYTWFCRNPDFDNLRATRGFASLLSRAETAHRRYRAQYTASR
jgi:TolB-like protein